MHRSHGSLLRKGRVSIPHQIYLITTVTHKRQPVFSDWVAERLVIECLKQTDIDAITLCFVIMPDHLHWFIQLETGASLQSLMQRFKSCSGYSLNQYLHTSGRFWQPGYHDHALRPEEDVKKFARYVIANPLRAELVDHVRDYPLWDTAWL